MTLKTNCGKAVHDGTEAEHVMTEEKLEKEAPPKKKKSPVFVMLSGHISMMRAMFLRSGGVFQHTNYMRSLRIQMA